MDTTNRSYRMRGLCTTVLGGLVVSVGLVGVGGSAQAATKTSETEYQCAAKPDGLAEEAKLKFKLKVPKSVSPGEDVTIKGTATMIFGSRQSTITQMSMADTATLTSSDLSVVLKARSAERELAISKLKSKPAPTKGDSYKPSAKVTLPGFVVPEGVRRLSLKMPSRAATGNPAGNDPANVIFTATVTPNGGVGGPRKYGCWLGEGKKASTIARIPVSGPAVGKSKSKSKESGGILVPEDPVGGSATGGGPSSSAPGGDDDSSAAPEDTTAPAGDGVPVAADSGMSQKSFAAIPPNTKIGGLVVPTWALMFFAAVTPLAIAAFFTVARRRLSLLSKAKGL